MIILEIDQTVSEMRSTVGDDSCQLDLGQELVATAETRPPSLARPVAPARKPLVMRPRNPGKKPFRPHLAVYETLQPLIARVIPIDFPPSDCEFDFIADIKAEA